MLWQVSYAALQLCGLSKPSLSSHPNVGVFAGAAVAEFSSLPPRITASGALQLPGPYTATGAAGSIISNRISYVLGLEGPSMSIDTACSSALVAADVACHNLNTACCSIGVTVSLNTLLSPGGFVVTCQAHMLSPQGHCKTFDASANGYVRAEGCCAMVLQSISEHELTPKLCSTSINQDGRTANLTSPNGLAQQQVISRALQRAEVKASSMSVLSSHGTGTSLGDPIEVAAQCAVLGKHQHMPSPLATAADKSNVGHLEVGAGMVGLLKLMLILQQSLVAPNLHLQKLNPYLDIDGYAATFASGLGSLTTHNRNESLAGGVSSFGFGGTNGHAVLAEPGKQQIEQQLKPVSAVRYAPRAFPWWNKQPNELDVQLHASLSATEQPIVAWERQWPSATCAYLANHTVDQTPVVPSSCFVQLTCAALEDLPTLLLSDFVVQTVLFLDDCDGDAPIMKLVTLPGTVKTISISSYNSNYGKWLSCASTTVGTAQSFPETTVCEPTLQDDVLDTSEFYGTIGNENKKDFRSVVAISLTHNPTLIDSGMLTSRIAFDDMRSDTVSTDEQAWLRSVAWMDACGQAAVLTQDLYYHPFLLFTNIDTCQLPIGANLATRTCATFRTSNSIVLQAQHEDSLQQLGHIHFRDLHMMKPGTLQRKCVLQHMYQTAWTCLANDDIVPQSEHKSKFLALSGHDASLLVTALIASCSLFHSTTLGEVNSTLQGESDICILASYPSKASLMSTGNALALLQLALVTSCIQAKVWLIPYKNTAISDRIAPAFATLSGLAKVAKTELQDRLQCIAVDVSPLPSCQITLACTIMQASAFRPEPELSVQSGRIEILQLQSYAPVINSWSAHLQVDESELFQLFATGGTGAIGLLVANWYLRHGSKQLVLLSRSGKIANGTSWDPLSNIDCTGFVRVVQCNAADVQALMSMSDLRSACPNRSLVHASGVLADSLLINQSQKGLHHVWAPKAHTAWYLHSLWNSSIQSFLSFSSVSAMTGGGGQANYAAANSYLDGLSRLRHAEGLAAVSIQWGAWAGAGMAANADILSHVDQQGSGTVSPEYGVRAVEMVLFNAGLPVVAMVPLRWPVLTESLGQDVPSFLQQLAAPYMSEKAPQADTELTVEYSNPFIESLRCCQPKQQLEMLEVMLLELVTDVSQIEVLVDEPLMEAGLDSLAAIELRNQLSLSVGGIPLPAGVLFDHPTVAQLVQHLHALIFQRASTSDLSVCRAVSPADTSEQSPLEIVGSCCLLPGSSDSVLKLWTFLSQAANPMTGVPSGRWSESQFAQDSEEAALGNKCYVQSAGYVNGLECFDNSFFRVSPMEAVQMDPQQHNLLEVIATDKLDRQLTGLLFDR